MNELIKAMQSLINDIEAMRCIPDDSIEDSGHWFGLFSRHCFDWDDGASIEWPNLAISLEEVKTALEQAINNNAALDEAIKDAIFMFKDIEKARELPPFAHVQAQYVATGRNLEKALSTSNAGRNQMTFIGTRNSNLQLRYDLESDTVQMTVDVGERSTTLDVDMTADQARMLAGVLVRLADYAGEMGKMKANHERLMKVLFDAGVKNPEHYVDTPKSDLMREQGFKDVSDEDK